MFKFQSLPVEEHPKCSLKMSFIAELGFCYIRPLLLSGKQKKKADERTIVKFTPGILVVLYEIIIHDTDMKIVYFMLLPNNKCNQGL